MILLLEIISMTLIRGIVRFVAMFQAINSIEFAIIERPGLGDDGRLFPPYVNGVSQPFVVLYHDR